MTDLTKPSNPPVTVTPEQLEEKRLKEKEEKRDKEREAVRKQVEEAAKAHDDLGKKFLKEDAEELEAEQKKAEKK